MAAAAVQLVERPVVVPLARLVEERRWGLLKVLRLPVRTEILLGAVLLDYTLYLWHILTHKVLLLWRFHQVHHVDLDLDASTALRFHLGELVFSVLSRAAQVLGIGICPLTLSAWQAALTGGDYVPPFQYRIAQRVRAPVELPDRYAAYARHSSFNGRGGDQLNWVERVDALGLAAWHAAAQRSAR
jgi:hypothetical protein